MRRDTLVNFIRMATESLSAALRAALEKPRGKWIAAAAAVGVAAAAGALWAWRRGGAKALPAAGRGTAVLASIGAWRQAARRVAVLAGVWVL